MPARILIVPDKFKGTLSAAAAADALARGWRRVRPRDTIERLPMSDGGDGFGDVMSRLLRARRQTVRAVDAAHRPGSARWWWEPKSKTALIESAAIIGLAKLRGKKFHPFDLDTFGLGVALRATARKGARHCIIGLGGTATNDGGFGLARALGWKFFDRAGDAIERWTDLPRLARIQRPRRGRAFKVIAAVDVRNPLLGRRGATRVYGPQKGLRPGDFEFAETCLRKLAAVFKKDFQRDLSRTAGAGAAGGLGFGLAAFLDARLEPGFELFARFARLDRRLRAADLVITGEGRLDASTLMGKGVGEIARRCRRRRIPCVAFAGVAERTAKRAFTRVRALTELTHAAGAKAKPAQWLERAAAMEATLLVAGERGCRPRVSAKQA